MATPQFAAFVGANCFDKFCIRTMEFKKIRQQLYLGMFGSTQEDPCVSGSSIDNQQITIIPVDASNNVSILVLLAVARTSNKAHIHMECLSGDICFSIVSCRISEIR